MKVLHEKLRYDPDTGILYKKYRHFVTGETLEAPVNVNRGKGYLGVYIHELKQQLYVHRVAVFLMTGEWPIEVDHINGIKDDNRWCNLRPCTSSENKFYMWENKRNANLNGVLSNRGSRRNSKSQ